MRASVAFVLLACLSAMAWNAAAPVAAQEDDLASPKLRVEWAAFKKLYDTKQAVVVDVRDATSYAAGHIPGARSIPLDTIETHAAALKKLGKPIVLYCA